MACPTCSHTVETVIQGRNIFHCPRCGTLRMGDAVYVPKLVDRCREFEPLIRPSLVYRTDWHRLGIQECISREGERT